MNNTVIFTSFFSAQKHPQNDPHLKGVKSDGYIDSSFNYIKKFYESCAALNLQVRIFYDNLTDEFVNQYSTDKIRFVKVINDGSYSNNDARFFHYEEYLSRTSFDYVFCSDCSDVVVKKDPTELFALYPNKKFFICEDSMPLMLFPYLQWHISHSLADYERFHQNANKWELLNAGLIGGRYEDMVTFLGYQNNLRKSLGTSHNWDMWVIQFVMRYYFSESDLQVGFPTCSKFKGYETERDDVFFVHK